MFEDHPKFEGETLSYHEQTYIRGKPKQYLLETIRQFNAVEKSHKIIVEIGASRRKMSHDIDALCLKEIADMGVRVDEEEHKISKCCCNDGHATYFWLAYTDAEVHSVDVDTRISSLFKSDQRLKNGHFHLQDGISFLKEFSKTIDLLYLDAWDIVAGTDYAMPHLEAYLAARDKLADDPFILIDDTDVADGGKGRLLIPVLLADGYQCIFSGRQTLFRKKFLQ